MFETLVCSTKLPGRGGEGGGGGHMRYIDLQVYTCRYEPHSGGSVLQCFERSNAIKIRNGIMFDFYLGLPLCFTDVHCKIDV